MKKHNKHPLATNTALVLAASFGLSGLAHADFSDFTFGGYIKADTILIDQAHGKVSGTAEDILVPGAIGTSGDSSQHTNAHAKESRFYIKHHADTDTGAVDAHVEMDFVASAQGDERISNSYSPRLRHAYISYNGWLVGQTWSTFMNTSALAETLDFAGAGIAAARPFVRQSMIRYSDGNFTFALENPESTLTDTAGNRITTDDSLVPDIVASYRWLGHWGQVRATALVRQIAIDNAQGDDSVTGGGVQLTGKIGIGERDDLRFSLTAGNAIGRYNALNAFNAGIVDANGDIELTDQIGGYLAYRHFWGDSNWRSTFAVSHTEGDYDTDITGTAVTSSVQSASINLLFNPAKKLTIGAELSYAERELENGDSGDQQRLQFSAKYAF